MSGQVLLRDLVAIPEEVYAGDYVLTLFKGIDQKSTVADYVVTPQLAGDFDRALGLMRSALENKASRVGLPGRVVRRGPSGWPPVSPR